MGVIKIADILGRLPILIINSRRILMHSVSDEYVACLDKLLIKFKPGNNSKNISLL